MRKVIIIGGDNHNTLGVIRSLGEAGLTEQLILLSVSRHPNFVSKSKYVHKKIYFKLKMTHIL